MDIIKSYLETMFANLPATNEVLRAKDELLGMMEDKYNELINEGKSENEAIGTVISEFGNLDELGETLGLNKENTAPVDNRRALSLDETKEYIKAMTHHGFMTALGVFLCIISTVFPMVGDMFKNDIASAIGAALMCAVVACGVALFIITNVSVKKYEHIKKHECILDYSTIVYVQNEQARINNISSIYKTLGVIFCITSIIPSIIFEAIPLDGIDDLGGIFVMIFAGIGVFFIVLGCMMTSSCKTLLTLNSERISGSYVKESNKEIRYINNTAATIMSVFWPTVTCIYLSVSFITFAWFATWVIWPIAAIIHAIFKTILKDDTKGVY